VTFKAQGFKSRAWCCDCTMGSLFWGWCEESTKLEDFAVGCAFALFCAVPFFATLKLMQARERIAWLKQYGTRVAGEVVSSPRGTRMLRCRYATSSGEYLVKEFPVKSSFTATEGSKIEIIHAGRSGDEDGQEREEGHPAIRSEGASEHDIEEQEPLMGASRAPPRACTDLYVPSDDPFDAILATQQKSRSPFVPLFLFGLLLVLLLLFLTPYCYAPFWGIPVGLLLGLCFFGCAKRIRPAVV